MKDVGTAYGASRTPLLKSEGEETAP